MLSYQNIKTIANYESKTLFRTWFFKIFAIIAILFLSIFHILTNFDTGANAWPFHALSSNIPYINIKFLNVIQSIIAVFLASGFLKKDKKLDTSVVIYVRPMSNAEYVLGKTVGVFKLFLGLNILSLLIAFVVSLASSGSLPDILPYFLYPLVISIPSLMFIFGLSFVTMSFVKNQSITFLLLLGYIGVCVFYLGSKVNPLFDYTSFNFPLIYSDMVGFSNWNDILLHRGGYLIIGMGLIMLTVVKLERLDNAAYKTKRYLLLSLIFMLGGIFSVSSIWINTKNTEEKRTEIAKLNNKYYNTSNIDIEKNDISLEHHGNSISCHSQITITNKTAKTLNTYFISLNPGLIINTIQTKGKALKYKRQENIIEISDQISKNESKIISIKYSGTIDEDACYTDVPTKTITKAFTYFGLNIPKQSAFVNSNYVVLTPEANWYPTCGLSYNPQKPVIGRYRFAQYSLKVKTDADYTAISQGVMNKITDGEFSFTPEHPLTQLSLLIGEYQRQEVKVDSITYSIHTKKGHDYFTKIFKEIKDTLPTLIKTMLTDYEIKQKRNYPYKRISLVEAPAQFKTYNRLWTNHQEVAQPEMLILPEMGLTMPDSDLERRIKRTIKWRKRNDEGVKEKDIIAEVFSRNMYNLFLSDQAATSADAGEDVTFGMTSMNEQIYSLYPNFYTFTNAVESKEYPLVGGIVEVLTKDETQSRRDMWMNYFGGVTKQEKANLDLNKKSLKGILNNALDYEETLPEILHNKANYFKAMLINKIDKEQLRQALSALYEQRKYQVISFKEMMNYLQSSYDINLDSQLDEWYNAPHTAGFVINSIVGTKIEDDDQKKFQLKINISNHEPVDGIVNFKIILKRKGGRRGGGFAKRMANALEYSYLIKANSTYEIGIVTGSKPVMLKTNTLVSKNIPSKFSTRFEKFEESNDEAFSGLRIIQTKEKQIIIVDNEDPGFKVIQDIREKKLKSFISSIKTETKEKYKSMRPWSPPSRWTLFAKEGQYGKYIRSAYYAKANENNKSAEWTANIKKAGYYEVFFYYSSDTWSFRRRSNKRSATSKYNINIHSDDGLTKVDLDLESDNEDGWLSLGSYYFSKGEGKVELTDKTNSRSIIADAVKWVRKE